MTGPGKKVTQTGRADTGGEINQVAGDQHIHHHCGSKDQAAPWVTSLPAGPPDLIGRDRQVWELLELLAPDREGASAVVVSAVHGLAGIGKTALALQVAHQAVNQGWFEGGALFVDMAGYDPAGGMSAAQAVGVLLRALGVDAQDLPPSPDEQAGLWQAELARRAREGLRVLVLADNVSTPDQVAPLVPAGGMHRLLVTSRDILASLTSVGARLIGLDDLDTPAAVALIGTAVLRAYPADTRPDNEAAALERVVRLCGRLPLALQIVAAILVGDPGMPIGRLAGQLSNERTRLDRIRLPETEAAGGSAPVRAAFSLSYQRLRPEQQRVFRLIGLNLGPHVATEAIAALTGLINEQAADVGGLRSVLAALARAGLVTEAPIGSGRWRMHDLIKVYAAQLAHESDGDECVAALHRLLGHYLTATHAADDHLRALPGDRVSTRFDDRDAALAWLDVERPNLIAAVTQAASAYPVIVIDLATCLYMFLGWRRHFDDAITTSQHALTAARELGERRAEGSALNNLGMALREVRRFDEAIEAQTQAATIAHELGERRGEGTSLNNLGAALQEVRRFDEAIDAHTQAATIAREFGDRQGESAALNNLGSALQEVRRFDEAIRAHTQAVTIAHELGDRHGEGGALNNLGIALREVRRFDEAIDAQTQAATIAHELGNRHGEGAALNNLGSALREVRRFDEAIDAQTQAATIAHELGNRHGESTALNNLGSALQKVRRFDEAIRAHTQAATIAHELGNRHGEGGALNNLGIALREVRRFDEAIDAQTQAVAILRELGARHSEAVALASLQRTQQVMRSGGGVRGLWRKITGSG